MPVETMFLLLYLRLEGCIGLGKLNLNISKHVGGVVHKPYHVFGGIGEDIGCPLDTCWY